MNPLSQMLAGIVDHQLEGAACAGRWETFDPRGDHESADEHDERVERAQTICARCPVRGACHGVSQNMRPAHRTGVWAGTAYDHRGRPVRMKETDR